MAPLSPQLYFPTDTFTKPTTKTPKINYNMFIVDLMTFVYLTEIIKPIFMRHYRSTLH